MSQAIVMGRAGLGWPSWGYAWVRDLVPSCGLTLSLVPGWPFGTCPRVSTLFPQPAQRGSLKAGRSWHCSQKAPLLLSPLPALPSDMTRRHAVQDTSCFLPRPHSLLSGCPEIWHCPGCSPTPMLTPSVGHRCWGHLGASAVHFAGFQQPQQISVPVWCHSYSLTAT